MDDKDLTKLYERDARFRRYADRNSAAYGIGTDEVLSQALTREVARYYLEGVHQEVVTASTCAPMEV